MITFDLDIHMKMSSFSAKTKNPKMFSYKISRWVYTTVVTLWLQIKFQTVVVTTKNDTTKLFNFYGITHTVHV